MKSPHKAGLGWSHAGGNRLAGAALCKMMMDLLRVPRDISSVVPVGILTDGSKRRLWYRFLWTELASFPSPSAGLVPGIASRDMTRRRGEQKSPNSPWYGSTVKKRIGSRSRQQLDENKKA